MILNSRNCEQQQQTLSLDDECNQECLDPSQVFEFCSLCKSISNEQFLLDMFKADEEMTSTPLAEMCSCKSSLNDFKFFVIYDFQLFLLSFSLQCEAY